MRINAVRILTRDGVDYVYRMLNMVSLCVRLQSSSIVCYRYKYQPSYSDITSEHFI